MTRNFTQVHPTSPLARRKRRGNAVQGAAPFDSAASLIIFFTELYILGFYENYRLVLSNQVFSTIPALDAITVPSAARAYHVHL